MAGRKTFTVQARSGRRHRSTEEELLEATKRLLAQGAPLASLSVERIVAEAGMVRTTFYLHFRDKYELIERLAAEQEQWMEGIERAFGDRELDRENLRHALEQVVAGWSANHATLAAIIELAEYDPRMRQTWRAMMHAVASVAVEVFQVQWERSGATPEDPAMMAEALTWMIERSCHQMVRDPTQQDPVASALAEVLWRVLHTA
jgi:AcrR family transcriptional regulator